MYNDYFYYFIQSHSHSSFDCGIDLYRRKSNSLIDSSKVATLTKPPELTRISLWLNESFIYRHIENFYISSSLVLFLIWLITTTLRFEGCVIIDYRKISIREWVVVWGVHISIKSLFVLYIITTNRNLKKKQVNLVSEASIMRLRDVGFNNRRRDSRFFIGT
jgi:hypothetical protein